MRGRAVIKINDPEDGERIAKLAGTTFRPGWDVCFATHSSQGNFRGGVILTTYTGAAMFIHDGSVTENWLTRDLLWVMFHYPFVQLDCTSLIGLTPRANVRAMSLALKVGFEVETVIKDCLPGHDDLIVSRMWRQRCRWLRLQPRGLQSYQKSLSLLGLKA